MQQNDSKINDKLHILKEIFNNLHLLLWLCGLHLANLMEGRCTVLQLTIDTFASEG